MNREQYPQTDLHLRRGDQLSPLGRERMAGYRRSGTRDAMLFRPVYIEADMGGEAGCRRFPVIDAALIVAPLAISRGVGSPLNPLTIA